MKKLILFCLFLSGCSSTGIPEYLDNKTVKDKQGCIFLIVENIGDTVFLKFIKELSESTCKFGV